MTPLISFIIPIYNIPETMLRECISSIESVSLTEAEREIIVVEDGSSVSCQSMFEKNNTCVKYYYREENHGVSAARNFGISKAKGRYIQFVDGDDKLNVDEYNHVINIIKQNSCDIVAFDYTCNEKAGKRHLQDTKAGTGVDMMKNGNIYSSVWSYIYIIGVTSGVRFDEETSYSEDDEFVTRVMIKAKSIVKTNAQAYFYRLRTDSATGNKSEKNIDKRLNDIKNVTIRIRNMAKATCGNEREALERRTAQMTMNYIYQTIMLTKSYKALKTNIEELKKEALFPMPLKRYTKKYYLFALLANNFLGSLILTKALPTMKPRLQ